MTRGQFGDFFLETMKPALELTIINAYKRWPQVWTKLFRQVTVTTGGIYQTSQLSGVGTFRSITEGADIQYDRPVQGFDKTFKPARFGLGIQVSQDMVEDDQKAHMVGEQASMLANSCSESLEIQMASDFNNAFSGSFLGPDNVCLCSASHPLVKAGGVQNNVLSVAADFDNESLALALTDWETQLNSEGAHIRLPRPKVLAAPANRWAVAEVLESKMRSDTAHNATNPFAYADGGMPDWLIWEYLTDPDNWFLVADPDSTKMMVVWKRKPYTTYDFNKQNECGSTMMRYKVDHGWADWYGIYGIQGS
jgi:hypothetical protein